MFSAIEFRIFRLLSEHLKIKSRQNHKFTCSLFGYETDILK